MKTSIKHLYKPAVTINSVVAYKLPGVMAFSIDTKEKWTENVDEMSCTGEITEFIIQFARQKRRGVGYSHCTIVTITPTTKAEKKFFKDAHCLIYSKRYGAFCYIVPSVPSKAKQMFLFDNGD